MIVEGRLGNFVNRNVDFHPLLQLGLESSYGPDRSDASWDTVVLSGCSVAETGLH